MKKAQGISMNVVIIAALALLVLVVLSVIFLSKMGVTQRGMADCRQQGGQCFSKTENAGSCPTYAPKEYPQWVCFLSDGSGKADPNQICCLPAGTTP